MDACLGIFFKLICLSGLFLLFFAYLGFPILLWGIGGISHLVVRQKSQGAINDWPTIQVIISCYNEESIIADRINNILEQGYPKDKLSVLIISDGSTDNSNSIVSNIANHNMLVRLFSIESNVGKNNAINLAFSSGEFKGDLLCFTDADTVFDKKTLLSGATFFSDNQVGLVGGNLTYWLNQGGANRAEGMYWRLENFFREAEGNLGLLVCCPGALIIMRRELFMALPIDANTDFALPLSILSQGYQTRFDVNAHVRSVFPGNQNDIHKRRNRTIIRALTTMRIFKKELPWKIRAILFWHRTVRFHTALILLIILLSNLLSVLFYSNTFMSYFLIMQLIYYLMAFLGLLSERFNLALPFCHYPFQFLVQNLVALGAIISFFRGSRISKWDPPR